METFDPWFDAWQANNQRAAEAAGGGWTFHPHATEGDWTYYPKNGGTENSQSELLGVIQELLREVQVIRGQVGERERPATPSAGLLVGRGRGVERGLLVAIRIVVSKRLATPRRVVEGRWRRTQHSQGELFGPAAMARMDLPPGLAPRGAAVEVRY